MAQIIAEKCLFSLTGTNCTLDLDANYAYESTPGWQFFKEVTERFPSNGIRFILQNAIVTYSGGELIPINSLTCINCVFEFKSPTTVPPIDGQKLTNQLLTADLSEANVYLAPGL